MKKILSLIVALVLGFGITAHAVDTGPYSAFINYPGAYGSTMLMTNHSTLGLGRYPGSNVWTSIPFVTDVNLVYGQPVVITTNTTNGISVSGTTTAGDTTAVGFAIFPSAYNWTPGASSSTFSGPSGSVVQVATGGVIGAFVGVNVTKGDLLTTSTNALYLTETAASSVSYTAMTKGTASGVLAEALQTISMGTATSATCQVLILK